MASNQLGLNALLLALALAGAAHLSGRVSGGTWPQLLSALALVLALTAALRDAAWVVIPALIAAAVLGSLAVSGGETWAGVLRGLVATTTRLRPGVEAVARATTPLVPDRSRSGLAPLLRGAALTVCLLGIFGGLFASGDAAFGHLAGKALPSVEDLAPLPGRVLWFFVAVALAGALATSAGTARGFAGRPPGRRMGPTEWVIALAALDLLFAAFVTVQATVLFGRDEHVLITTGLTYAEYAREGFAQLLVAAALTAAVVGSALRWSKTDTTRQRRLLRALLAILCGLTLVVLASALHRLDLYQDAFGATRLRLSAGATMFWLGGIFALVLVRLLADRHRWLPRGCVLVTGLSLLAFTLSNPDRRIAQRNVERFEGTGRIDLAYLTRLSADAVPTLVELPPQLRHVALSQQRARLSRDDSWAELNLARVRARQALQS